MTKIAFRGVPNTTGKVDVARPFVLTITRPLVGSDGRYLRGLSHVFSYDDEKVALEDYAAARKAKMEPLLRRWDGQRFTLI